MKYRFGVSLLHHAASAGNVKAVEGLVDLKIEYNSEGSDDSSRMLLRFMVRRGEHAVADVLIAYFAI
jgi:ankyrin repeat protein